MRLTKAEKAARERFQRDVTAYIISKGAVTTPKGLYRYRLETPAGPMGIDVWDNAVMTRFMDPVDGERLTGCSRTGKWNFHFDSLEFAAAYFREQLERVLAATLPDDEGREQRRADLAAKDAEWARFHAEFQAEVNRQTAAGIKTPGSMHQFLATWE
jgi:hypothetical protein